MAAEPQTVNLDGDVDMTEKMQRLEIKYLPPGSLVPSKRNARTHSKTQIARLAEGIRDQGFNDPIEVDSNLEIISGHGRLLAALELGLSEVPVVELSHLSEDDKRKRRYMLSANQMALLAGWNETILAMELADLSKDPTVNIETTGFTLREVSDLTEIPLDPKDRYTEARMGALAEAFLVPPFSVIDGRAGAWNQRKGLWRDRIGDAGESRENLLKLSPMLATVNHGVSILDPCLAEVCCLWFGIPGGLTFDPFAGDTVFGYVAAALGHEFVGIELRQEQADLNQARVDRDRLNARYICDTSENMDDHIEDESVDFVFSCPPYADLEVYSDDPRDLSTMDHDQFFDVYTAILQNTYRKLRPGRFACIVVGEVRNKAGAYLGLVPRTIELMQEAGYVYYNEMILVTPAGTLPLRAGKLMKASRKVGKSHQNILVFWKGKAEEAGRGYPAVQVPAPEDMMDE